MDQTTIGFCFLTRFRKKPAYDRTAEIGLYLTPGYTGKGTGQAMVRFLEDYARGHEIDVILATISGENRNSIRLFEILGYERCAHYRQIAIKFGRRLDLMNYEKILEAESA
jgi:phosphinothricin acetyltransferase